MGFFLLTLKETDLAGPKQANAIVVSAENSADAIAIAQSNFTGDSNAAWANATVLTLADIDIGTAPNMLGWRLRVAILDSTPVVDITVVGAGSDDTMDELGTLMATALNLESIIANASYTTATQTLVIAQGATDALGDLDAVVEVLPPVAMAGPVPIPGIVASVQDLGASSADLNCVFAADTHVLPTVLGTFQGTT